MGWHRYKNGGGSYYRGRRKSGKYFTKNYEGRTQSQNKCFGELLMILIVILVMLYVYKDDIPGINRFFECIF